MIAPKLGAATFIIAVIVGQMIASATIDSFGLMGFQRQALSASRLIGLIVIVAGICIMQFPTLFENQKL